MVRFIQINSSRFISTNKRFSLIKYHDQYQILMNSKLPSWDYKFSSVECAQRFLNSHDYVNATIDHMPMSSDDIEFIIDMYGFNNVGNNKWSMNNGDNSYTLSVGSDGSSIKISERKKGKLLSDKQVFTEATDAIDYLDKINSSLQLIKCSTLDELKTAVTAAGLTARDITRNLVRVKSSNVWAYMIDIKDRHDKEGNVFVQFKGKNGGPGDIYEYANVPIRIWRGWLSAPSKGHYFWKNIRNNFVYRKLTGDKRTHLKNGV